MTGPCAACSAIVARHDEQHPAGTGCGCLDALDALHAGHGRAAVIDAWHRACPACHGGPIVDDDDGTVEPCHDVHHLATPADPAKYRALQARIRALALGVTVLAALLMAPAPAAAAYAARVPVLEYHHVLPAELVPAGAAPSLYVTTADFRAQLGALRAAGWRTITARRLDWYVTRRLPVPSRSFVVTIDDGRQDGFDYAAPILRELGDVATFYVIASRVGTPDFMTGPELRSLRVAGNEIGNHTTSHRCLTGLPYAQVLADVRHASAAILGWTGVRPATLSYPHGCHDATTLRAVAAAGITLAVTSGSGILETYATRLSTRRVHVHKGETGAQLLAALR